MNKYLQNPFSNILSKLNRLTGFKYLLEQETTNTQFLESPETDTFVDENEYIHITDWVEPSIYFTIFCPHRRF
ncbi:MAG: hypothetical protein WBA07_00175 [Rivularia sp. (in: cyanobacteria)]